MKSEQDKNAKLEAELKETRKQLREAKKQLAKSRKERQEATKKAKELEKKLNKASEEVADLKKKALIESIIDWTISSLIPKKP